MLQYCCKIQISEVDGFPMHICSCCEKDLEFSYCFILKCAETDQSLRSMDSKCFKECTTKVDVKVELKHDSWPDDSYDASDDIKDENVLNSDIEKGSNCSQKAIEKKCKYSTIYECNVCSRQCPNPSKLMIHMRSHTNEKPYSCPSCDKRYKDRGSLKRHIEKNHLKHNRERKFICESCGKGFFSKADIKIHMRTHTGETPYACAVCPARFTQVNALKRHQLRHTGERPYPCLTCHKKFCTKDELKNHNIVHTNIKSFECSICNAHFKHKNNLRKHVRRHSMMDRYICNYCKRNFSMKNNLMLHIQRLHSSKSGFCNLCSKDVANIEMHSWKHTGERPLKCEHCTSSFSKQNALTKHINYRHKFKNKFECRNDGCMATFSSNQKLEYHVLKLHGNIVPYPCNKCSRGFYRKSDLARHTMGTHKEKLT